MEDPNVVNNAAVALVQVAIDELVFVIEKCIPPEDREDFVIQHVNRLYTERIVERFINR